ncbi:MAG: restriction endonuclease subunit S, partial [Bacteroidota bacterium]
TLFARITPCLENGKICKVRGLKNGVAFGSTEFLVFRGKETISDNDFVFYLSRWEEVRGFAEGHFEGTSGRQRVPKNCFANLLLELPDYSEQIQIASILNSLDDKIDLLHRQNKTLEQLAETIFRQWFVEEAEESWEVRKLDDLILFDPREKFDTPKEYKVFDMKCLSNTGMHIDEGVYRKISSATTFRNGDTLLAKITPCLENGKTGFVMQLNDNEVGKGSTEFVVMRSVGQVSAFWIYCLARNNGFRDNAILSMTGTSGRQRVQIDLLKNYEVKINDERMEDFHNAVEPMFKKIKANQTQIRTLTQLRDTLLPKLMSGEVRVKDC